METKLCPKCKEEKSKELYYKDHSKPSGLTSYCKECLKGKRRKYTRSNTVDREKQLRRNREWKRKNRDKVRKTERNYSLSRKLFSLDYKGGKCEDCGIVATMENRSIFDFHHIDPSGKGGDTGRIRTRVTIDKLKEELDKCVLLCANCHRLRHQDYNDGLRPTL